MKAVSFNLIERVEDSTSFLTCAVDALWILQEELSVDLSLDSRVAMRWVTFSA